MADVSDGRIHEPEPGLEPASIRSENGVRWPRLALAALMGTVLGIVLSIAIWWYFNWTADAPYITKANRLRDVVAAIQVLGTYRWHHSTVDQWTERLGPGLSGTWTQVFGELGRPPLRPEQIAALMNIAIQLHSQHREFGEDDNCR